MATVRRCFRATLLASLSFAVCCGVVSGFLPSRSSYGRNDRSAVRRRNMINPTSTRPRSSTSFCSIRRDGGDTHQGTTIDGARLSSPAMFSSREGFASRPASSSKMSLRMVSDYGDGQQEKHNWKRTDNAHDDNSSVTDTINSSMTADSSHDVRDGDGKNPLLQTLGGGKYVVQSVLGTGSTASTYRCKAAQQQETSDDRQEQEEGNEEDEVAVKVLTLRDMKNWKQLDLFQREAKVLKGLKHPGIPRYLDCFEEDTEERGKIFLLVQELAPGISLGQMVENGWRPTEDEVRRIAEELLEILGYLHELRPPIVHRDIKPENIVIEGGCSGGRVFLVDFGGVQDAVVEKPSSTIIGTYGYMSPEQFRGEAMPASDLYGLGGTLLFLLSGGRHPSDFQAARMEVSFKGKVQCGKPLETLLTGLLEPFPEDRLSAEQSLRLLRFGPLPDLPAASSGKDTGGVRDRKGTVDGDRRASQLAGEEEGYGDGLLGKRQPVGARASIRRDGGTLVVDVPPEGLSGEAASVGAFAVAWNSIVMGMTASILTGGASAIFQAFWMAPFWFAGGKLSLETVRRICLWERLEVGIDRWSLNQRLAPLRRLSSPSSSKKRFKTRGSSSFSKRRSTRTSQTESGKAANDAASWEADWHSAKVGETGLTGNTDDLVACRSFVERDSREDGRTVEKWSLQIIAGIQRYDFGETLPPEEKMWIANEVDKHIQACLMAQARGADGDKEVFGELR